MYGSERNPVFDGVAHVIGQKRYNDMFSSIWAFATSQSFQKLTKQQQYCERFSDGEIDKRNKFPVAIATFHSVTSDTATKEPTGKILMDRTANKLPIVEITRPAKFRTV